MIRALNLDMNNGVIECKWADCDKTISYSLETNYSIYCRDHYEEIEKENKMMNNDEKNSKKCSLSHCCMKRFDLSQCGIWTDPYCLYHLQWKRFLVGDLEELDIVKRGYHLLTPALEIIVDACIPNNWATYFDETKANHYWSLTFFELQKKFWKNIKKEQFLEGVKLIEEEIRRRRQFSHVLEKPMDEKHQSWLDDLINAKKMLMKIYHRKYHGSTGSIEWIFHRAGISYVRVTLFVKMMGNSQKVSQYANENHSTCVLPFHDWFNPFSASDTSSLHSNYVHYLKKYTEDCSSPGCNCTNCHQNRFWGCPFVQKTKTVSFFPTFEENEEIEEEEEEQVNEEKKEGENENEDNDNLIIEFGF